MSMPVKPPSLISLILTTRVTGVTAGIVDEFDNVSFVDKLSTYHKLVTHIYSFPKNRICFVGVLLLLYHVWFCCQEAKNFLCHFISPMMPSMMPRTIIKVHNAIMRKLFPFYYNRLSLLYVACKRRRTREIGPFMPWISTL